MDSPNLPRDADPKNPRVMDSPNLARDAGPPNPRLMDSPNFPRDTGVNVTLIARPLLMQIAQKLVCWRAERVFILEHYSASKSFAAVPEAF
jgi:hypothetical protein